MTIRSPKSVTNCTRAIIALSILISLAGCGRDGGAGEPAEKVGVEASRVAPEAAPVVSGIQIRFDDVQTSAIVVEADEVKLQLAGVAVNDGPGPVSGVELSLTYEQPEGSAVGGRVLRAHFEPALQPGSREPIVLVTRAPSDIRSEEAVHTRIMMLGTSEEAAHAGSHVLNQPLEATPRPQERKQGVEGETTKHPSEQSPTQGALTEEIKDGDEQPPPDGAGG